VLSGITAWSSSLLPEEDAPEDASTPITVSWVPSTVTVCPTGLTGPENSSLAVSAPSTTTCAASVTS
jgi:hypothetical protein